MTENFILIRLLANCTLQKAEERLAQFQKIFFIKALGDALMVGRIAPNKNMIGHTLS